MADKQFSVLLEFLTNAAKAEKEVEGLEDAVKGFEGAFPGDKLGEDFKKFQEQLKKTKQTAKETSASLRAEAALLSKQAAAIVDGLKARQIGALNEVSSFISGISRTSLVAGTAIAGGIFAAASNYVKNAPVATQLTREWDAATASLSRSQDKVGATLAEVSLPLLQKAARLADQASDFVERNPEIVRAALNTGLVLASIGVVGTLVSKGIKLVADVRYLASIPAQITAARLQDAAANKQLAAAQIRAKDLGVKIPGGGAGTAAGAVLGTAGTIGLFVAGVAATAAVTNKAADEINKLGVSVATLTKNSTAGQAVINLLSTALTPILPLLPAIQSIKANLPQVTALLEKFGLVAKKTNGLGIADASAGNDLTTAAADHFEQILNAYQDYKRDDLALVQQHYADRQKVIADSVADEQKANQRFSQSVARLRQRAASELTQAAEQFTRDNIEAEQEYARQRADIVRSGGEEIQRIQQDLQETLRRNELDHTSRVEDLTRSRDALGLAQENRRFQQQQDEARREASLEVRQRRAEIAQRLADLQASFEQERAQRQVDYQVRTEEIRAQLALELAEERAQHQAEIREIQAQRAARIRELDTQLAAERQRRQQYFIQQVRDLDATLLGERNLRQQNQALMEQDLNAFLARYRAGMSTIFNSSSSSARAGAARPSGYGTFATGGYATYGTYLLGDAAGGGRGKREYVLSGRTTELAERALGGLTQQKLLDVLAMAGGNRNATYVDQRRIDQSTSKWSKREMQSAAMDALMSVMGA